MTDSLLVAVHTFASHVLMLWLLNSLSDKYPWEKYEPPYFPIYDLNITTIVLLKW